MENSGRRRSRSVLRLIQVLVVLLVLTGVAIFSIFAFGLPAVSRTGWARARLEKILSRCWGSPVRIGSAQFTWKDGLILQDLAAPPTASEGLEIALNLREARIRPQFWKLLRGNLRTRVVLSKPELRLTDRPETELPSRLRPPRPCRREVRIESLRIREGTLTLESPRFQGRLLAEEMELDGAVSSSRRKTNVEITKLNARLNGGTLNLGGVWATSPGRTSYRFEASGSEVESNELVARALRRVLPLFEVTSGGSIRGRLDFQIKAEGDGENPAAAFRAIRGEGTFQVRGADLRGTRLLTEAGRVLGIPDWADAPVRESAGALELREGRIFVRGGVVRGPGEIRLDGWTDPADGTLEFTLTPAGSTSSARVRGPVERPRADRPGAGEPF